MNTLSHIDRRGRARMVDVGRKTPTRRHARVQGVVHVSPDAFAALQAHTLAKGDAFTVAHLAGIQAAKRTWELIPLCHPVPIEHVEVACEPEAATTTIRVTATATTTAKTGIEMEAFTACLIACLALYDMVKAVDPSATITDVQLVQKSGGKREFSREISNDQIPNSK
ncbi:MAG: cyclic pyranopterin monophosphate synthase MoaC [Candidatus Omnitrophica bacterium]|nr:cyclic pyranopterin monophosphate synthase MoaC [Candidatus Omnitrophota bacterium]